MYVLNIISDRAEGIGRGEREICFLPYTCMYYSIIVSHRRTFGIHNARRAFGAEEVSYRSACTSLRLKMKCARALGAKVAKSTVTKEIQYIKSES